MQNKLSITYKYKRNVLFELISSIELDMRSYILINQINVDQYKEKIEERIKKSYYNFNEEIYKKEKEQFLDFNDYVEIIREYFKKIDCLDSIRKNMLNDLSKIAPVRNRVMHSRPLLADDDRTVLSFQEKYNEYKSIISFDNLDKSIALIKSNPNYFYEKSPNFDFLFIENPIENNLPMVDYDDTGFIGRDSYKKDIIKKLNSAHPIISIIGDGGIGKTSTVLSCIYDIIDEQNFAFEKVIWVGLKTKSLQDGEFKPLRTSFRSFDQVIENNQFLNKEGATTIDFLLFFMKVYKTLLILDNLETINSNEIKNLFEDIPIGSKILITSRIGIGEYESRLVLSKFTDNEAKYYFRKLVNVYSVKVLSNISDEEVENYVRKLFCSPLCIKWFVLNVGKGNNPDIIINNQDDLIEFCLSNVYEKLGKNAKYIIQILLVRQIPCSIAELVYLNDSDYIKSVDAINELCACNFLTQVGNGVYDIPEFSRKYLNKKMKDFKTEIEVIKIKSQKLYGLLENLQNDIHLKDKNHPLSFFPKNDSEKISTIYMLKAIEESKKDNYDKVEEYFDVASKAAPKFSDMYKASAFLYAKLHQDTKANANYLLAIDYAEGEDKAYVKSLYALYLLSKNQFKNAENNIKEAISTIGDNPYFLSNYARVLKYGKRFDDSIEIIESVLSKQDNLDDTLKKILYSEMVDIKARQLDLSEDNEKKRLVNELILYIKEINKEYYSLSLYKALTKTLKYMLIIHNKRKIKRELREFYDLYFPYVLFYLNRNNTDIENIVSSLNDSLGIDLDLNNYSCKFTNLERGNIYRVNEEGGYGFIKIKRRTTSLYFHYSQLNYSKPKVGDSVKFIPSYKNGKWSAFSVTSSIDDFDDE